jgi:hypothetical protein
MKIKQKQVILGVSTIAMSLMITTVAVAAAKNDSVGLSVTVGENMTLDCGADVDIDGGGSLIAGSPVSNSTTCTVTTNDEDGYNLAIVDDNGAGDVVLNNSNGSGSDFEIADKTAWNLASPNAATWSGTGLGFSVYASTATKNTTWWGTGNSCHDSNNLYAGVPDTNTNIMEHTSYSNSSTTTSICYRADVPSTQASGEYTGSVTYTATGRP